MLEKGKKRMLDNTYPNPSLQSPSTLNGERRKKGYFVFGVNKDTKRMYN